MYLGIRTTYAYSGLTIVCRRGKQKTRDTKCIQLCMGYVIQILKRFSTFLECNMIYQWPKITIAVTQKKDWEEDQD
jgi:hypothetical protein